MGLTGFPQSCRCRWLCGVHTPADISGSVQGRGNSLAAPHLHRRGETPCPNDISFGWTLPGGTLLSEWWEHLSGRTQSYPNTYIFRQLITDDDVHGFPNCRCFFLYGNGSRTFFRRCCSSCRSFIRIIKTLKGSSKSKSQVWTLLPSLTSTLTHQMRSGSMVVVEISMKIL